VNVVMMGPPGAGKGTQAERFAREHGIPKISTGEILREAVSAGTELGNAVRAVMASGGLVGDDLIIDIVRERLSRPDARKGFVLDGFPRTVPQARALDEMMAGRSPLVIIEIRVPDEELVRRVKRRRICATCGTAATAFGEGAGATGCRSCGGALVQRSDDTEDVIRERLKVYWRETQPMIAFYQKRPTYRVVNGAQPPEQVRSALSASVASATGQSADVSAAPRRPTESQA
jgi:adenylate kinase